MQLTKDIVAKKILSYLQSKMNLKELVEWAENSILQSEFKAGDEKILRRILGQIGVADVKQFGLTWEDCEKMMKELGYKIKVDATAA